MKSTSSYDVCIVGAGVAGSSLAAYLGKHNLKVALIEKKWQQPDEIIGELLQPSGVQKLVEMGFAEAFENIEAQPIQGYVMYLGNQPQQLSYPLGEEDNPYHGYGFRYGRFVQSLRSLSQDQPLVDRVEGSATKMIENDNGEIIGIEYQNREKGISTIHATLTVISQGSMASMRSSLNRSKSRTKGFMVGVVLEDTELPFANHGHVIMADPAPVLAYPVGNGKIRILIDFPSELPVMKGDALPSYLEEVIKPQLPEVLQDSFHKAIRQQRLKGKPTHLLASRPLVKDGAVLLGDALNMRHPTTGSGMTVALTDVKDLGSRLTSISKFDRERIRAEVAAFYKERHKENATVNILAYALYRVFRHEILRVACFEYLKRGGKFSAEPMSILSGISRSRMTLLRHFFAVAWLAVVRQLKPFPTVNKLSRSFQLIRDTLTIIIPLVRDEVPKVEA